MKLRIRLIRRGAGGHQEERNVTLTVDVTVSVGEVARGLVRAGAGDPRLLRIATHRVAPLTLLVTYPDETTLVLDSGDPIATSGLRPGSRVEPVLESAAPPGAPRSRAPFATLTVLNGEQEGATFLIVDVETAVGRDRSNRIELHGSSVSRRHAVIRCTGDVVEIEDLGSSNGTALHEENGARVQLTAHTVTLPDSCIIEFGTVAARVNRVPHASPGSAPHSTLQHLQAPLVDPVFTPEPIDLPTPPEPAAPGKFPLLAMVAPLALGAALFLVTQSLFSLVFIGLSPLIMVGSWLDQRLTQRKGERLRRRQFNAAVDLATRQLEETRRLERAARLRETPTSGDLATLATTRDLRLWSRRPEHRAFLELRLGTGSLASRAMVRLPARGQIPAEDWERLAALQAEYRLVPDVPLLERLDRSGSLGIACASDQAGEVACALLVQVLSQHSPADLVLTAFASGEHVDGGWGWLAWVPHVDSPYSPIHSPHLAATQRDSSVLLAELEGLIATRQGAGRAATVRSRTEGSASDAQERLAPPPKPARTPAVVVVVLPGAAVDRARLVGLAEDGPDQGVHVLWLAPTLGQVPAACRTVLEERDGQWRAHFVREGTVIDPVAVETVTLREAERFGRALAPVVDAGARGLDESDLPRSVSLAQIASGNILRDATAILQNWKATDSLTSAWLRGVEREAGGLSAIVGQGRVGPVELDLRRHGPHALVGGTTGSGKSEFLQTWIISLAARHAPDRVTFLLVDYKGGAAFADCVNLPHTVGLVTDLTTHLVHRALVSLRAELRYREELLAEKGAKDLLTLERRGDPDAPPALVIVIDEFAALVTEIPEFVDGVIDIAQRGRSLGLHLILATQRPAGVIRENLRANTNLRVALRMADPSESSDVLGVVDAADFSPETPGRAAMRIGAGRVTHFQAGYVGGRSESEQSEVIDVRDLAFGEQTPWALTPEFARSRGGLKGPRDLEALAANICQASERARVARPRRPWVDQLPEVLPLLAVPGAEPAGVGEQAPRPPGLTVTVGISDEPHLQRQVPYTIALAEVGNVAVFGGAGMGKTTTLLTLASAAIHQRADTQIYGIDSAGGQLGILEALPNTGDIVPSHDRDRLSRLFELLMTIVEGRTPGESGAPPVLLLLDGLAAFRDAYEHAPGQGDHFALLIEIAQRGRAVGVHVVLTSERAGGLPLALGSTVLERVVLRLPSEHDYGFLGVPREALASAPPGRALRIGTKGELQIAVPGAGPSAADAGAAIHTLAETQRRLGIARPAGVPPIPASLPRARLPLTGGGEVAFAIDTRHLGPVAAPREGLLVVSGPAGSGRSTAIRSLLDAFAEQARLTGGSLDGVLVSPRRSPLRNLPVWGDVADSPETRPDTIRRLTLALGGVVAEPSLVSAPQWDSEPQRDSEHPRGSTVQPQFPASHRQRGVVVIEDIGGFDGSGDERSLAALLKVLRRSEVTTIVEGENATIGAVWDLASPLRGARWALALQPDAGDQPSIFTASFAQTRRSDFPPGRGLLIHNAAVMGVHVASS